MTTSQASDSASPKDIHTNRFADLLTTLPEKAPITEAFEETLGQKGGVWYRNQQEHMVGWFWSQATRGTGQYTRSEPNRSAKTAYNRLLSAGGLLWINEAMGRPSELVQEAADAAKATKDYRTRCAAIRKILPWEEIMAIVNSSQGMSRRVSSTRNRRGLKHAARQRRRS